MVQFVVEISQIVISFLKFSTPFLFKQIMHNFYINKYFLNLITTLFHTGLCSLFKQLKNKQ